MVASWFKNFIKKLNVFFLQLFLSLNFLNYLNKLIVDFFQFVFNTKSASKQQRATKNTYTQAVYRFFLINYLKVSKVGTTTEIGNTSYLFLVFRASNLLNYILTPSTFFYQNVSVRLSSTAKNTDFYKYVLSFNGNHTGNTMYNLFLVGLKSVWLALRFWIVPLFLGITSFFFYGVFKTNLFSYIFC